MKILLKSSRRGRRHNDRVIFPDKDEFLHKTSGGKRMPIYRELLADLETPLSAYWKLAQGEKFSFLLESVTGGEQLARYSIIGVRPSALVQPDAGSADPLSALETALSKAEVVAVPGMPAFTGGAVGLLAYELVQSLENKIEGRPIDDLGLPPVAMMIIYQFVVFDHAKNLIKVVAVADEETYDQARVEIDRMVNLLQGPLPPLPGGEFGSNVVKTNLSQSDFEEIVRTIKEYIAAGDGIQMVPSLRFETHVQAHPLSVYRALRSINPSPYMFLLRLDGFDLVGASPEILVSLHGGTARVRPIAGTRPRGATPEEDAQLGAELLRDEKERAEHIMLVDLGRNDLGKVCEFGSVRVNDLMVVERYSHVMHIVSDVTGTLAKGRTAFDLIRASFPAGTVSGAPKVRAMQIIDELEPTRRGSYAGAVGFVGYSGDADLCIAIRTILIKDGTAYVQAGAGIVFDSDPAKEYEECCNKARAALRAIEMAQAGL